jgi:hypothetical protein
MPGLLGTNAEFILSDSALIFQNSIIHLNALPDRTHVGYIVGGIESPEINISETDPSVSVASSRIFKVYINKLPPDTAVTVSEYLIKEPLNIKIFPNPFGNEFNIEIENENEQTVLLTFYDYRMSEVRKPVSFTTNHFRKYVSFKNAGSGIYFIEVKTGRYKKYFRIIKS